jgi:hypothetical protein
MFRVLGCLLGIVLVGCAVASAATPKPGVFRDPKGGESGGFFTVVSSGKAIKAGATVRSNFKCNRLNAVIPRSIPVTATGAFTYTGKLKGQPGTVTVTGKFTGATKATITTVIKNGSCASGTIRWTATGASGNGGGTIVYN